VVRGGWHGDDRVAASGRDGRQRGPGGSRHRPSRAVGVPRPWPRHRGARGGRRAGGCRNAACAGERQRRHPVGLPASRRGRRRPRVRRRQPARRLPSRGRRGLSPALALQGRRRAPDHRGRGQDPPEGATPVSVTATRSLEGAAVWPGEELARSTGWIHTITPAEQDELDGALHAVQLRGRGWRDMTREDFPIPRFARPLAEVARELEDGRGLVLLRRVPVERYSEDELRVIYWGLGLHLGTPRYQNGRGELIGDVRDENRLYGAVHEVNPMRAGEPRTSRNKARSAGPLRFHTDRVDVVTLLCVRAAARGGLSKVVASSAVYNAIL